MGSRAKAGSGVGAVILCGLVILGAWAYVSWARRQPPPPPVTDAWIRKQEELGAIQAKTAAMEAQTPEPEPTVNSMDGF